jgi:diguanylate cyclase (GGDEF)-like protein/PAS domain S-box-containing protein
VDCARLTGRTPDEMLGLSDFELDPIDRAHGSELLADEQRIIATGEPMIAKEEIDRLPSRSHTWVETSKFPLRDSEGTIIGTFGISHEVTRWELAEQKIVRMAKEAADAHTELMRVEGQLRAVLNGSTDVIAKYDRGLRYQYINPAGERSRGLTLDQLIGRTDRETGMTESSLQVYEPALNRVLETGERGDVEFCVPNGPDRQDEWFNIVLSPDHDTTGAVVGVLTSMRDITEVKRAELALAHQAMHDSLTGLANRHLLTDRLNQALMRMERFPSSLVLFFIDLDYFKVVNDTHGHAVGDRVLVDVARRLEQAVRREDTVARFGGDEFIVLCDRVITNDEVYEIADRFVRTLAIPFARGTETVRMSASVGVVVTDDPQAGTSELLHRADSAMYRAKEGGRSRFEILSSKDIEPRMRSPRARSDISPGVGTMSGMSRPIPAPSVPQNIAGTEHENTPVSHHSGNLSQAATPLAAHAGQLVVHAPPQRNRRGGARPSSTRSTPDPGLTATVTGSGTCPASRPASPIFATSAWTPSGSHRSMSRPRPTLAMTSPTTATSTRSSERWPTPTLCSPQPTTSV